jgi:hypothetical protein
MEVTNGVAFHVYTYKTRFNKVVIASKKSILMSYKNRRSGI